MDSQLRTFGYDAVEAGGARQSQAPWRSLISQGRETARIGQALDIVEVHFKEARLGTVRPCRPAWPERPDSTVP